MVKRRPSANPNHIKILNRGVEHWNLWRKSNPTVRPELFEIDAEGIDLSGIDLSCADLRGAYLPNGKLQGANLYQADLYRASLWRANFGDANLAEADLSSSNLNGSILRGANLNRAILRFARLTAANVKDAVLSGCFVYGCSLWNLKGIPKEQTDIVITPKSETVITVDNVEVAQFIYLLLNNQKIRDVIDTITAKVVLILGRFTADRKAVLDRLRDELRKRNYLPILFDFEKPSSRDVTETVSTLAHMARFIIADITDAKCICQELERIVPNLPSVPIQPLLLSSQTEYGMFEHYDSYPWVLAPVLYNTQNELLAQLQDKVIEPAETKAEELIIRKTRATKKI